MPVALVILFLYIAALFVISWFAKKLSEGKNENYALAGRKLSTPLIAVTIIGLAVGGASTVGVSESAFRVGLSAGWYTIAWGVGAIFMGIFMAKKYREQNITTITELVERHHTSGAVILGVFIQIVIQMVIISLQYIAGGSILHAILPDIFDMRTGMIVSAVVFIGITFMGGMWSASLCNVLNIVLIYLGTVIATGLEFSKIHSLDALAAALPEGVPWFSFIDGVGSVTIVSWLVTFISVNLALQAILQISLGAKDAKTAKNGFIWGGLIMLPVGVLAAFLGIVAKATMPEATATSALPQVIIGLQPLLAGITLAAMWAADVSTACNLLLSAGTLFSSDIYKRFINPSCSDAKQLSMTRLCVIISGVLTFGLAMLVSSILGALMVGLALTAAFSVLIIVALFFPKYTCKAAGFWTLLTGFLAVLAWQLLPQVRIVPNVIYLEWIVCVVTYVVVALIAPGKKEVAA